MQHQRHGDHFADLGQALKVDFRAFGIQAMCGADGDGEAIHAGQFDKAFRFLRVGEKCTLRVDAHVIFHAAQTAQLSLDATVVEVAEIDYRFHQLHVLFKRIVAAVDHRATHASVNLATNIVEGFVMIEMQRQRHVVG